MTLEDPFFVVKDEVCKALNRTRGLYQRWSELNEEGLNKQANRGGIIIGKEDIDWANTELRNALRSIEWDLEDLEETIGIVEKNPRKFKIDISELSARRTFILDTKNEVQFMKDKISQSKSGASVKQVNSDESPLKMPQVVTSGGNSRYSRLVNEAESPSNEFIEHTLSQQQLIMQEQDSQLDQLASSMGNLKVMSHQIGNEVDEQAVMLDDFGQEMEHSQSKMENTLSKMAKVMHLTNDRRQWAAIGALSGVLAVVVILFFVL